MKKDLNGNSEVEKHNIITNENSLEEISNNRAGREKQSVDLKTDKLRLSSLKRKKMGKEMNRA